MKVFSFVQVNNFSKIYIFIWRPMRFKQITGLLVFATCNMQRADRPNLTKTPVEGMPLRVFYAISLKI